MRRLSYSQVSAFTQCPRKWFLQYIKKRWPPTPPAFAFGKSVHDVMAGYWQTGKEETIDRRLVTHNFSYAEDPRGLKIMAKTLVLAGYELLLDRGIGDFVFDQETNIELEKKVGFDGFIGYLDLVATHGQDMVVVDWKTTSQDYGDHDILSSDQLTAYAWLCHKVLGILPKHVAYVTLSKRTGIAKLYYTHKTFEDVQDWERKVEAVRRAIHQGDNWKNPSACINQWGKCYFYEACWVGEAFQTGPELEDF